VVFNFLLGFHIFGVNVLIAVTILSFSSLRKITGVVIASPQEEIERVWRPRNLSITPNPAPRNMHVMKYLDNMHHLAGTPHLADDLLG
jgi:hypothetical protein